MGYITDAIEAAEAQKKALDDIMALATFAIALAVLSATLIIASTVLRHRADHRLTKKYGSPPVFTLNPNPNMNDRRGTTVRIYADQGQPAIAHGILAPKAAELSDFITHPRIHDMPGARVDIKRDGYDKPNGTCVWTDMDSVPVHQITRWSIREHDGPTATPTPSDPEVEYGDDPGRTTPTAEELGIKMPDAGSHSHD